MGRIANIDNKVILDGRRNNRAWFAPNITTVPPKFPGDCPEVRLHALLLLGNDIGEILHFKTTDFGKTWSLPVLSRGLYKNPLGDDIFEGANVGLFYHKKSDSLAGFGLTLCQRDLDENPGVKMMSIDYDLLKNRTMCYACWPIAEDDFRPWKKLGLPAHLSHLNKHYASPAAQNVELSDGTIIQPFNCISGTDCRKVGTFRIHCDGTEMTILDAGNVIGFDKAGGLTEPSIIEFDGQFLMTLRSQYGDNRMYLATSEDGLNWENFKPWCWGDGSEIETICTQQHLLGHGDTLYLVYTRVNELSNGVFRQRAPLFIAQIDLKRLCLIRETERIVFPENGARIGNFAVTNVTENEAWIVTGEWLEQRVEGYQKDMRFWCEIESAGTIYNRIQYVGDLLLARVTFE